MNQSQDQLEKPASKLYTMGLTPLMIGGEVGCLTLLIVGIALVAGLWLDRTFGTRPMLTILLLLGSAPFSLILTFWVATRSIRRMTASQSQQPMQARPIQEEDISD